MVVSWTEKYRPKSVEEFVDNGKALRQLDEWLTLRKRGGRTRKKAALLHGPPGIGKTSCVEVLAEKQGLDLISLDASDWRGKRDLERIVGAASTQRSLLGTGDRLILLDELEGMSGTKDRGGLSTLTRLVKDAGCPIVLIVNNVWNPKFSRLRNRCLVVKFRRVPTRSIASHLRRISRLEGVRIEERALRKIAERAKGDLRSAINDLQALAQNKSSLAYEEVGWLQERDRRESIFSVLNRVFKAETCLEARRAVGVADVHYNMLFEWIYENAPDQLSDAGELSDALDALSRADIYFRRIRVSQNWKLLKYALDQMTAGVATARNIKSHRWVSYRFPERIKALSRSKRMRGLRKEIGLRLGERLHMGSNAVIREILPYLRIIFVNDHDSAAALAEEFELDDKMIEYLSK